MRDLKMMQGWYEAANWTAAQAVTWSMLWDFRNLSGRNIGGNQGVKGKDVINQIFGCQCTC